MTTTAEMLRVIVNGEPCAVQAGESLAGVLRLHHVDPDAARGVAVAVNEEVVPRRQWAEVAVGEGDTIEIVTAKQGG